VIIAWCHSVDYSVRSVVIFDLLRGQFGSDIAVIRYRVRNASVAILHWFGMDQARLSYRPSGAFAGLLDVRCMLGELMVLDRGVRSLDLLGGSCWFICRCACHHLTRLTYRRALSPLVDSCLGAFAAASILNWWLDHTVHCCCTSGTVIVRGRGCDSGAVIPLFGKSLLRQRQISCRFVGNTDWKELIRGRFRSRFFVVNFQRGCVARDCWAWVGILFELVFSAM